MVETPHGRDVEVENPHGWDAEVKNPHGWKVEAEEFREWEEWGTSVSMAVAEEGVRVNRILTLPAASRGRSVVESDPPPGMAGSP